MAQTCSVGNCLGLTWGPGRGEDERIGASIECVAALQWWEELGPGKDFPWFWQRGEVATSRMEAGWACPRRELDSLSVLANSAEADSPRVYFSRYTSTTHPMSDIQLFNLISAHTPEMQKDKNEL